MCFQSIIAASGTRGNLSSVCVNGLLLGPQRLFRLAGRVGSISNVQPWSRSRRKTMISQSSLRWSLGKRGVGVQQCQGLKRFDWFQPQKLKQISLVFEEKEVARAQEFVLRWSFDGGNSFREIVRQQWNFSPPETIREVEEYQVELSNVTILELSIVPNTSGGPARASLKSLRLFCSCDCFEVVTRLF